MITRDYLLRQIHQLAQVLAHVLFLKSSQQEQRALKEIDEALQGLPGLDVLLHADLTREEVLALGSTERGFAAEKAIALADVLKEKALLLQDAERQQTHLRYALWLYEAAVREEGAVLPLDVHQRIEWLNEEVRRRRSDTEA